MRKKNNPEQETEEQPTAEEQEAETPAEENEDPQEEVPTQDQEEQEEPEEEEPAAEEEGENPQDQEPGEPAQEPASDESAALRQQLLQARGQIAAYSAGVAPGMVDDAVTLAMAEAAKAGEVTEAALTKAMEAVLKRYPEWKAEDGRKKTGGFKLGADRDNSGAGKKQNTTQNVKRWNRFKN